MGALSSTIGPISTVRQSECFLVLWARFSIKERVFPYTLGTLSIKRESFLILWVHLVLKRIFPYTLGTFSIKERVFPYVLGTLSIKESLLVL